MKLTQRCIVSTEPVRRMKMAELVDELGALKAEASIIDSRLELLKGELKKRKKAALQRSGKANALGKFYEAVLSQFTRLLLNRTLVKEAIIESGIVSTSDEAEVWLDEHSVRSKPTIKINIKSVGVPNG